MQVYSWKTVKTYNTFEEADAHRKKLEGPVKVRRMGKGKNLFAVKAGTKLS